MKTFKPPYKVVHFKYYVDLENDTRANSINFIIPRFFVLEGYIVAEKNKKFIIKSFFHGSEYLVDKKVVYSGYAPKP